MFVLRVLIEKNCFVTLYSQGQIIYKGKINEPDDLDETGCDPNEKFTVLVHGWTQSCDKDVMKILAQSKSVHVMILFRYL